MTIQREKFATQMDPALLAELRLLANSEGRQIQSLLEEAVQNLLREKQKGSVRDRALALHESAMEKYDAVFRKLAE